MAKEIFFCMNTENIRSLGKDILLFLSLYMKNQLVTVTDALSFSVYKEE